jgi:hypothetical protein
MARAVGRIRIRDKSAVKELWVRGEAEEKAKQAGCILAVAVACTASSWEVTEVDRGWMRHSEEVEVVVGVVGRTGTGHKAGMYR